MNPIISFAVDNIFLKPPSSEKYLANSTPPLHQIEPMFDRWVGMLEVLGVWLLRHAKVVPP